MQAILERPQPLKHGTGKHGTGKHGTGTSFSPPVRLPSRGAQGEDPDGRDVELCLRGSPEAFNRLVRRHERVVLEVARFALGNLEDARDAAQESFLRAYRSLRSFQGTSSFRTWMLRIAVNTARSQRARGAAKKRGGGVGPTVDAAQLSDPFGGLGTTRLLERREVKEAVERAIEALSPQDREVITLRDLEGVSYEHIARRLKLPVGTIKSRVHRARLELRQRLGHLV